MTHSNRITSGTVLVSGAISAWRALEARGIEPAQIFAEAGVDPAMLRIPGKRAPVGVALRLWRIVEGRVPDPSFGIEVARQVQGTGMHGLGYAWLSSHTLAEALRRLARYSRVLTELWSLRIEPGSDATRVSFVFAPGMARPALWLYDALTASLVRLCRLTYGDAFAPVGVTLVRSRPDPVAPFTDWFRCPIEWDADTASMLCRPEELVQPLPTSNPDVALANERIMLEYLERLDRADIAAQVRRRILELLPSGPPTQMEIARAVALSPRTLHRRLAEAKTSFAELLDHTRRELAAGYLQRTDYAIAEIAYLVGFAEVSSFNRAFRRWTGQSPSAVRRGLEAGGPNAPDAKGVAS
jgi:AraC-like DNA-binding protein